MLKKILPFKQHDFDSKINIKTKLKTVDFLVTAVKNFVEFLFVQKLVPVITMVISNGSSKSKGVIKLIAFSCLFSQNLASVL